MIRLFYTATGQVTPLRTRKPGEVSMYVCGPTVYGPPHLGHGRFSLVFDVLRRYLTWSGQQVTYVSNITDIDDKIIAKAASEGRGSDAVAKEFEDVWYEAMDAIGVMRPDEDPHATAYVDDMVAMIEALVERDSAYVTPDGVYLSVESVDDYGLLSHQSLDDLLVGGGERTVVGESTKRHPSDFALWKLAKPGEPSWPSPWGDGRPGWHTECVVMSLDLLGDGFDLHGGGRDLAFPHHENERAQAVALGREFAGHWVHNGFVEVGGEKMSKSLGNFTTLVDLIATHDPRAYRLLVLGSHYRSPVEVTEATIVAAENALDRLDALARRVVALPAVDSDTDAIVSFRSAMDNDLDTPAVSAQIFGLVTEINRRLDDGDTVGAAPLAAALVEIATAVGLSLNGQGQDIPAEIEALARQRDEARAAKDWAAADDLRNRIQAAGWIAEDSAEGTRVRPN
ncbi:MAG TPA: cysteine--tRNA ligase [Microthrixaceae bacterium]|nr:cysteine--tRNA ligase [Microthrixaceae bacterium]